MIVFNEYKFTYTSESGLEEYLRKVMACCEASGYDREIRFIGSSVCELYLRPKTQIGFGYNPFRPRASAVISRGQNCLEIRAVSRLSQEDAGILGMTIFLPAIMSFFLMFDYGLGSIKPYVPLMASAIFFALERVYYRWYSKHIVSDILLN